MTPSFDRLAPLYAWIEAATFGGLLQWCRTALLGEVAEVRRVLILGEGNGRFVSAFLRANSTASVDVVDGSPAMVQLARQKAAKIPGATDRVRWHVADARTVEPTGEPFDLIVANFFLDCFPADEVEAILVRLTRWLVPDGRWLVGDFAVPRGRFLGLAARGYLTVMYAFFRLTTGIPASRLADPRPLFEKLGFEREREIHRIGGFLSSSLWRRGSEYDRGS